MKAVFLLTQHIIIGGIVMLKYYITEFKSRIDSVIPVLVNEKYFLWIIGSIFLLGIVTKWIVVANYDRLIKKAENMTNPKNKTLRQIKMKFESIKQVNGVVANPMLLVQRHLNKCKAGHISLNKMNNIINWCVIIIIGFSGFVGWELYSLGSEKELAVVYGFIGCFLGFVLHMINQSVRVKERQMELAYIIADFLENSAIPKDERHNEMAVNTQEEAIYEEERGNNAEEELILNQVIGEFLQ